MDIENKILNENMGQCIFPIQDPFKKMCGEPTLLDGEGNHMPFCSKHANEIPEIFKHKLAMKGKKRSFRGKAFVYK